MSFLMPKPQVVKMPEAPPPILSPQGNPKGSGKLTAPPTFLGSDALPNAANVSNKTLLGQ